MLSTGPLLPRGVITSWLRAKPMKLQPDTRPCIMVCKTSATLNGFDVLRSPHGSMDHTSAAASRACDRGACAGSRRPAGDGHACGYERRERPCRNGGSRGHGDAGRHALLPAGPTEGMCEGLSDDGILHGVPSFHFALQRILGAGHACQHDRSL